MCWGPCHVMWEHAWPWPHLKFSLRICDWYFHMAYASMQGQAVTYQSGIVPIIAHRPYNKKPKRATGEQWQLRFQRENTGVISCSDTNDTGQICRPSSKFLSKPAQDRQTLDQAGAVGTHLSSKFRLNVAVPAPTKLLTSIRHTRHTN